MSKKPLRLGFHDFLNAQTLLIPLRKGALQAGLEIVIDTPAVLAEELYCGRLDLAMIPSIEYLRRGNEYRLVPDIAIASRGPVGTVLLIARKSLADVKSIALDRRSRTSVALLDVLFGDRLQNAEGYHTTAPDIGKMLAAHDAALLIGDQALDPAWRTDSLTVYDLSEEWFERTGKTFVHAVIAARAGVALSEQTLNFLRAVKRESAALTDAIAENHARENGLSVSLCLDYLRYRIKHNLGEEELAGLTHFRDQCHTRGLIPGKHKIQFVTKKGV